MGARAVSSRRFGSLDCRLIEPSPGTWVAERYPGCRSAMGLPVTKKIGRPRTRVLKKGKCAKCGVLVESLCKEDQPPPSYCRSHCYIAASIARQKLPEEDVLRKLYVVERLSTPKIAALYDTDARSVNRALEKAGIERRKHTVPIICTVPGCTLRAQKVRHPNNGSAYGTLCGKHRAEHRLDLSRRYRKETKESKR